MPIHDAYARRTPYELLFPDEDSLEGRFEQIREEADERGADATDPEAFVMLMAAGEALRRLRGPDEDPALIRQHGTLLYHAFHFHEADEPLWLLTTPAARYLVEGMGDAREPDRDLRPPSGAGYLQLPQHLFWARLGEEEGSPPESLDGFFWTLSGDWISVLTVLGVRDDRPGFSVLPLPPLPLDDAPEWATTTMRDEGGDYRSDIPGSEIESLYEVRTPGEILKLVSRVFLLVAEHEEIPRSEPAVEDRGAGAPEPSGLAHYRIPLDG